MIETIAVTLLPVLFLIGLFSTKELFRRSNIDMDGEPPIDRTLLYPSKYAIPALWAAMVLQSWGVNLSFVKVGTSIRSISLILWYVGFILLFAGRFGLGDSSRIGSPRESTNLKVDGLFRFSRDPMYLGVFSTIIASVLYTMNPILLVVCIFVIAVHHKIVLAEEQHLQKVFGQEYADYRRGVRRYV